MAAKKKLRQAIEQLSEAEAHETLRHLAQRHSRDPHPSSSSLTSTPLPPQIRSDLLILFVTRLSNSDSLKRKLAAEFEHDREAYTQAKADFILRVLERAG